MKPSVSDKPTCPTDEQLRAVIEGESPRDLQDELTVHLSSCEACQSRLEELAAVTEWVPIEQTSLSDDSKELQNVIDRMSKRDACEGGGVSDDDALGFLKPPANPLFVGEFGQYDIVELVGRGGMGLVLKARDRSLDRVVAIKVLLPVLASDPDAKQRFVREAKAAAAVVHENVVTIHAVSEDAGLPFLVMQFIDGRTLENQIENGPLLTPEILRIGSQIAAALGAAHAQGLIHRDIKPSNVLLENGVPRVKVTDFGLAKAVDDTTLTRTGVMAGTPQYMSPEQAESRDVDHRADLFSLGSVMYAMCTGQPPFAGDTTVGVIRQVCDRQPKPICELNKKIDPKLAATIQKLLEKDPNRRFQTAHEVEVALNRHLNGVPVETPSGVSGSKRTFAIALALVVVASFIAPRLYRQILTIFPAAESTIPSTPSVESAGLDFRIATRADAYATIEEAIEAAQSNDTIEIHGNGPYESSVIRIEGKGLTIRAADGFQPLLRLRETGSHFGTLLASDSSLTLQGLRLEGSNAISRRELQFAHHVIENRNGPLSLDDCIVIGDKDVGGVRFEGGLCNFNNVQIHVSKAQAFCWLLQGETNVKLTQSLFNAPSAILLVQNADGNPRAATLTMQRCTMASENLLHYPPKIRWGGPPREGSELQVQATRCLLDVDRLLTYEMRRRASTMRRPEHPEELLRSMVRWEGDSNFFTTPLEAATYGSRRGESFSFFDDNTLESWLSLFGQTGNGSIEGVATYRNVTEATPKGEFEIESLDPKASPGIVPGWSLR